jgi:anti-anti-sigma factor
VHREPFGLTVCDRTIRVHGDVDMAVSDQLVDTITCVARELVDRTLVVDMAWLTFLDSSGISALIRARKALEAQGKELVLHNVPASVRRTLGVAGVVEYLNVRSVA